VLIIVPVVAKNDTAVTPPCTVDSVASVIINILENDTPRPDLDVASVKIRTPPGDGSVEVLSDGTVRYTANCNFTGVDTFSYEVNLLSPCCSFCECCRFVFNVITFPNLRNILFFIFFRYAVPMARILRDSAVTLQ